ncbi:uncharacterized protein AB675_11534 [Cyphellophora attinorum]|uniref:Uncharacterized protein n=1 Tax=Cyphellophora attinorum TaxID=1664694 RepID=A0A0N1HAY2_9EURO|nr:uncharacterized protein AB675_11534 [Phialophora attinorum]KPI40075.1 hypothetical protein AB675_11534 [Phialophora attinorum]
MAVLFGKNSQADWWGVGKGSHRSNKDVADSTTTGFFEPFKPPKEMDEGLGKREVPQQSQQHRWSADRMDRLFSDSCEAAHPNRESISPLPMDITGDNPVDDFSLGTARVAHMDKTTATSVPCPSPMFLSGLSVCKSVADLQAILRENSVDLRTQRTHATRIFEHVTSSDWAAHAIAEYLIDPAFHPPGCYHHSALTEALHKTTVSLGDYSLDFERRKVIMNAVCSATRTGMVTGQEWLRIIDSVVYHQGATRNAKDHHECARLSNKLVGSYMQSPKALFTLQLYSKPEVDRALIADVCVRRLKNTFTFENAENTTSLAKQLLRFPRVAQDEILGRISGSLCAPSHWTPDIRVFPARNFRALLGELRRLDPPSKAITEAQAKRLASGIPEELMESDRLLVFVFVVSVRYIAPWSPEIKEESFPVLDLFDLDRSKPSRVMHSELLSRADPLLFQGRYQLSEDLAWLLSRQTDQEKRTRSTENLARMVDQQAHLLLHSPTGRQENLSNAAQVQELAGALNEQPAFYQQLNRSLVSGDKLSLRFVTRLLNRNPDFRTALTSFLRHKGRRINQPLLPNSISAEQALDTMNMLAVAFASSTVISSRMALKKVTWCYQFLVRNRAPVQFPITRALWHAGVTRQPHKASSQLLTWLLGKIARVEGEEVAQVLQTSSAFRRSRAVTFMKIARLSARQPSSRPHLGDLAEEEKLAQAPSSSENLTRSKEVADEIGQVSSLEHRLYRQRMLRQLYAKRFMTLIEERIAACRSEIEQLARITWSREARGEQDRLTEREYIDRVLGLVEHEVKHLDLRATDGQTTCTSHTQRGHATPLFPVSDVEISRDSILSTTSIPSFFNLGTEQPIFDLSGAKDTRACDSAASTTSADDMSAALSEQHVKSRVWKRMSGVHHIKRKGVSLTARTTRIVRRRMKGTLLARPSIWRSIPLTTHTEAFEWRRIPVTEGVKLLPKNRMSPARSSKQVVERRRSKQTKQKATAADRSGHATPATVTATATATARLLSQEEDMRRFQAWLAKKKKKTKAVASTAASEGSAVTDGAVWLP